MSIVHIVLFKLKDSLSDAEKKEVVNLAPLTERDIDKSQFCDHMIELKDTCLHPKSNEPYIISSSGGVDNSPEGAQVRAISFH
jgi:hypothetical protein